MMLLVLAKEFGVGVHMRLAAAWSSEVKANLPSCIVSETLAPMGAIQLSRKISIE